MAKLLSAAVWYLPLSQSAGAGHPRREAWKVEITFGENFEPDHRGKVEDDWIGVAKPQQQCADCVTTT